MDRNLGIAILLEEIVRSAYRARKSEDVQPLQWSILRYLSLSPNEGRDLASIGAYAGVTAAPASRAVKTLEERGLVRKEQGHEDRRAVSIRITNQGLKVLGDDPLLKIAYRLSQLPDDELAAISSGLRKLVLSEGGAGLVDGSSSGGRRR